jgi:hypothetical protein
MIQECIWCGNKSMIDIQACHDQCQVCGKAIDCSDTYNDLDDNKTELVEPLEIKRFINEGPEQREDSV